MNDKGHVTVHVGGELAERSDHFVLDDVAVSAAECVQTHHELQIVHDHVGNVLHVYRVWHRLHETQNIFRRYKKILFMAPRLA